MRPEEVKDLLTAMEEGTTSLEDALALLQRVPVEDLGFARVDTHRELRQGFAEAIYAEGKTADQVVAIATQLTEHSSAPILATRVPDQTATALLAAFPDARHHELARLVVIRPSRNVEHPLGTVAVVTAGTSDLAVAEEAAVTAQALGATVGRVTDVGVAGVHRVLAVQDELRTADVVIVVAGMDGALPSLIGGIVAAPVVAVPTSVGYGAAFDGLAALLTMLNSCAAGVAVVNIDNGFGGAMFALRALRRQPR
ncbi:MAG: nickel pincer cofactor biosynthesis protein LarB [Actinomycetota bacterium]